MVFAPPQMTLNGTSVGLATKFYEDMSICQPTGSDPCDAPPKARSIRILLSSDQRITVKSSFNLELFPFDSQTLQVELGAAIKETDLLVHYKGYIDDPDLDLSMNTEYMSRSQVGKTSSGFKIKDITSTVGTFTAAFDKEQTYSKVMLHIKVRAYMWVRVKST